MTSGFAGRVPTLWHGHGVASQVAERLTAGRETLVITDAALTVPFLASCPARRIEVDASSADITIAVAIARKIARWRPDVIVAVGGGSVLDVGKIASLALAGGRVLDYVVGHAARSALTFLPDAPPPIDIVAVPTTLGTSSETNSVGVVTNEEGHRLIVGRSLRPRHAIIDSLNLSTLTPDMVEEGALEAFLRLAGASTSSQRSPRGNSDAVALGRALLESATRDSASASGRLRLARLSAATQRTAALRGRDPYSARHWYVANEVSFLLGIRKMVATAAVIAAVWRRICSGDRRWGDRQSLENFWAGVSQRADLPLDPAEGISALIRRWRIPIPRAPNADHICRIAVATEKAWGNRQPMLAELVAEDFCDVLRDSHWSRQKVGEGGRPSYSVRRG
ncbi:MULTISPECIES: daptide-type RiPP biosynthesis dehydogenase [unclassified Microbacterium]|uniref:daptide-type RiPP biosynthesis dehydogenase n=1 Tax=unclassified Microbacterium TaxID=2609290 RepID=UPI000EA8F35F|nr:MULTISPECIES: daptide-type RiPP biosynthesis dehydogenase [unclassified Microbacterium]MBT2483255.1 iron-containing alcohol dehydrogenase [Microbacterium sp. ISL-108]RKN66298.1 iron-containing alcohol dehydrogenase [Microbacterium sp. CGR2]